MATIEMHTDGVPTEASKPAERPGLAYETDSRGRRIAIRKMGPLDRMRLFKAIGPANSKIEEYVGYAQMAYSVAEIDGEMIPPFTSELQCEAMVQRLGDEGFEAIGRAQLTQIGVTEDDLAAAEGDVGKAIKAAQARGQKETAAAAKN